MSRRGKIIAAVVVVAVLGAAAAAIASNRSGKGVEVRMEEVALRDLVATVTANGNIRANRTVDISSDVTGRVVELNVLEGDEVEEGDVLLRIDPTASQAALSRAEAALSQARSQVSQQEASLIRAERDYERFNGLWVRDSALVSRQQVEDAHSQMEVARATLESARQGVAQARATVEEARDRLAKTTILSPISGRVTRLNIELGETAIIGTMNNPGSLLLTVSDLGAVEAVMQVDETDVPRISLGDSALVEIDAFREQGFRGVVTRIGNSAVQPPTQGAGGQSSTIDFEVVIRLVDPPVQLRPDLSATADIITETRVGALSVPIIALTVRDRAAAEGDRSVSDTAGSGTGRPMGPVARAAQQRPDEGVFLVRDGRVSFAPVQLGIAGQDHFEVLSGVQVGDTVVSGPYQRIRELRDGDAVRPMQSGESGTPTRRGS
jgi:HlyD family secretion protein